MSSKTKTTATKEEARPALVPKLRFPAFRGVEGWAQKRLIDTADRSVKWSFIGGPFGSNLKSSDYVPDGVRIIQLQNIGDGEFFNEYQIFTTSQKADELLSNNIYPGEIIMSKMGDPVGRACLIPENHDRYVMCSDGIRLVVDEKENDKYFIYSLINSPLFRAVVEKTATGSTRKRIGLDELKSLPMWLPKKPEQQKIAECLSSVDELMAAQARKVDALKTHQKGLMQQLFPREGETQPRLRFPEFQNVGEWEVTTLGQLAKLVRGPFGGSLKKEIFVASGYAVYEQQHAIYSDFSSFRYHITAEKFHELRRFAVAANDIIMSCSGTMGKFAIIPDGAEPGVINQALLKLTPNGFCDTKFLKEVLELPSVQEKLLSQSAGGAIQNVVSVDQIKALPLRLPSAEEQRAVVGCLSNLDALITAETQKLETLKTHKKGLMQQLSPSPDAQ